MPAHALPVIGEIGAALSTHALRHRVLVSNIAQRDSIGYRRLAVRLAPAWSIASAGHARPPATVVPEPPGAETSLEGDLAALSSNALRYQALARSLGAYFSLLGAALDGGRA
jgi:flagellar basal body rod protein FlgB